MDPSFLHVIQITGKALRHICAVNTHAIVYLLPLSGMILGQGAFGRVLKAEAIGIVDYIDVLSVAVKMVKGEI